MDSSPGKKKKKTIFYSHSLNLFKFNYSSYEKYSLISEIIIVSFHFPIEQSYKELYHFQYTYSVKSIDLVFLRT